MAESILECLTAAVEEKDRPANQVLLITAGGADRAGMLHLGEDLMADLLLSALVAPLPMPKHLERVVLHRWGFGDAWELYPRLLRIAAPITSAPTLNADLDYPRLEPLSLFRMGRNDPCRCGSGKKAKFCHLAAPDTE
jgi:hypothetical protein